MELVIEPDKLLYAAEHEVQNVRNDVQNVFGNLPSVVFVAVLKSLEV